MSKALATYFATVNDIPDTEFKVEISGRRAYQESIRKRYRL